MGILLKIVLGLFGLAVLAGGGAYVASQQEPNVASGLAPIVASVEAAKSFDAKVDVMKAAADAAKKSGKEQAVSVEFNSSELTSKAQDAVAGAAGDGGLQATKPQIHLTGSTIVATSNINIQGLSLKIGVVAEPVTVDGKTQIKVREIQTGALPIPEAIRQQINAQIGQALDPTKLGLPIDVSRMSIKDGKLTVAGVAKP